MEKFIGLKSSLDGIPRVNIRPFIKALLRKCFFIIPKYEREVRMKRIARIALWVIYKAMEKAFLLLLIFSFIVVHVRLGMTVLGYIPFDQTNGYILEILTLLALVSNRAILTFQVFADDLADEIERR